MKNADNDNEEFSFQTLAAITARLLQPAKKQDEEGSEDREPGHDDEQRREANLDYIEQRLRDLAEFERRANGKR